MAASTPDKSDVILVTTEKQAPAGDTVNDSWTLLADDIGPPSVSRSLAALLVGSVTSPSQVVARAELLERVEQAIADALLRWVKARPEKTGCGTRRSEPV